MAVKAPIASVIIPVRGRRAQLLRLLSSLSIQDCAGRLEVVVVDNPDPANHAWLHAHTWPFALRYEHLQVANRGLARNTGAAVARGRRLLFVDSDVTPSSSSAVGDLLDSARGAAATVMMADVLFPPAQPRTLASHLFDVAAYFRRYRRAARAGELTFREFVSCAFVIERDAFATLSGFDEGFEHYGYEDVEFAFRAQSAGCTFALAAGRVHHLKHFTPAEVLVHAVDAGRSAVRFVTLHPQIEQHLPLGVADTHCGGLGFPADFDIGSLLAAAHGDELRWTATRGSGELSRARALLDSAAATYATIRRFGRFTGITTELMGATA